MTKPPISATATRFLLMVLGLLWLAFGTLVAVDAHPSYRDDSMLRWAMAAMAWLVAAGLAILAGRLQRRGRLTYWFAVALLASMAIVGILDELGVADLVVLVLTLLPLALLVKDRKWYLGRPPFASRGEVVTQEPHGSPHP